MMTKKDVGFIAAICKSKERLLVGGEKFSRMIEADSAEDAFRILRESGFGGEAEASGARDYEKLIAAETENLNLFLREYAPNEKYAETLLLAIDFHNADGAVRAAHGFGDRKSLTEEGYYPLPEIEKAAQGNRAELPAELLSAIREANGAFENGTASGARIGTIFLNACYRRKLAICPDKTLKKAIVAEIDGKNVSVALRLKNRRQNEGRYLGGGSLTREELSLLEEKDGRKIRSAFLYSPLRDLVFTGIDEIERNVPLVSFEREAESAYLKTLKEKKYETEGAIPFLLYAEYKRNELKNVRVVMAGMLCGASKEKIRGRLREGYDG